jgi:hypothetical protein
MRGTYIWILTAVDWSEGLEVQRIIFWRSRFQGSVMGSAMQSI